MALLLKCDFRTQHLISQLWNIYSILQFLIKKKTDLKKKMDESVEVQMDESVEVHGWIRRSPNNQASCLDFPSLISPQGHPTAPATLAVLNWSVKSAQRDKGVSSLVFFEVKIIGLKTRVPSLKSNIDIKNYHFQRELPFPNHRLACWSLPRQPVPTSLVGSGYHNWPIKQECWTPWWVQINWST